MNEFSFGYQPIALTSWAYVSALLMLAMFFKFNRFWSVRNLDLFFLILLSPGLILVTQSSARLENLSTRESLAEPKVSSSVEPGSGGPANGDPGVTGQDPRSADEQASGPSSRSPAESALLDWQRLGFIWLLGVCLLYMLRLLLDPRFTRKPLLEPNLSRSGLTFLACSLAMFVFADIVQTPPDVDALRGPNEALRLLDRDPAITGDPEGDQGSHFQEYGPGLGFLHVLPVIPTFAGQAAAQAPLDDLSIAIVISKVMATLLLVAIVIGLVVMGQRHFGNYHTGIAMAVVYLLLPSTLLYAGNSWHMLPAALTLWAVISFRLPVVSGVLIGLAAGVSYYPIFLLPLWFSFYWERGASRFAAGVVASLVVVVISLVFTVETVADFVDQVRTMFGVLLPRVQGFQRSIWSDDIGWDPWFRLPILAGFIILSISFVFWPSRKNYGTLIAYSAALMVAVQFWLGYDGGLFIAWYLPLALITFFRPNLETVTAVS